MTNVSSDIRYGLRQFSNEPWLVALAILSLSLGLGANTAIFQVARAVILQPIAAPEPDRLVEVFTSSNDGQPISVSSYRDYEDLADGSRTLSSLAAYSPLLLRFQEEDGRSRPVQGELVSGNYFETLGVTMARGRSFRPEEARPIGSGEPMAVVSHEFWTRTLQSDPGAIGRVIELNGRSFTVIGVTPEEFHGTKVSRAPAFWLPLPLQRAFAPQPLSRTDPFEDRSSRWLSLIGRLAPGADLERAETELNGIFDNLERAYPASNEGRFVTIVPASQAAVASGSGRTLFRFVSLLAIAVGFGLLIACVNVANLLLARAMGRRREIAVRLALGASRRQLIRQLVLEGVLLALVSGALALLVAFLGTMLLSKWQLTGRIAADRLHGGLDLETVLLTLVLSLITGVLFSLAPAFQSVRQKMTEALKDSDLAASRGTSRLRFAFVAAQVAVCLILLGGTLVFARSLSGALSLDLGFAKDDLAVVSIHPGAAGYDADQARRAYRRLVEGLESIPGVRSVSYTNLLPITQSGNRFSFDLGVEGYQPRPDESMSVLLTFIGPGYFETMGIPRIQGRELGRTDGPGAPQVLVVNETMAERFWGGAERALGSRIKPSPDEPYMEVVGVVADTRLSLEDEPESRLYLSLDQFAEFAGLGQISFPIRTEGDPSRVLGAVRETVSRYDADLPIQSLASFSEQIDRQLQPQRTGATLLGLFSVLALVLAITGIYGAVSYMVRQRSQEIGVRMSLGAGKPQILQLVLWWGEMPCLVGVVVGLVASIAGAELVTSLVYDLQADHWLVVPVVSALIVALVGALAALAPAIRATRLEPVTVLRNQ